MKKLIAFFCFLGALVITCNTANAYVDKANAVVAILDKTSGKTYNITLPVGSAVKYEKLNMIARTCKQTDPFMAENAYMFIEISTNADGQIFGGWMNKNAPGENPLQNVDFDVWLVRCE